MLTVYTTRVPRPPEAIDLSLTPLETLAETIQSICAHQTSVILWFGYLDGWMLTPQEEVLIRSALRLFDCRLVTRFPCALPHAWKNEIQTIYTTEPHGDSHTHNDGRIVYNGRSS